jgi:hypothetical protein
MKNVDKLVSVDSSSLEDKPKKRLLALHRDTLLIIRTGVRAGMMPNTVAKCGATNGGDTGC